MLYNEEIEQYLLGALLVSDNAYDDAAHLRQEYFYVPVNGRIFEHIKIMRDQGKTPTAQHIAQFFSNDNDLIEAGGAAYITDLANNVMSTRNTKSYADFIYSAHLRRMLKWLSGNLSELADNPEIGTSPMDLISNAETFISQASDHGSAETLRHIGDDLEAAIKDADFPRMGVKSGQFGLDDLLNGYQPGKLYVIAARPAMGKTAMGLTHAINAAMAGSRALFFSLEMTHSEIQKRLILRYGANSQELKNAYLYVDDKAGLTVSEIAQRARRHKRKHGIDIIFIDYLGLIRATDTRAQMVHQIGEITSRLKGLAKDLGIPVVLLCQLNRGVEGRDNKRPTMSDLRDSGAIEQDADVVMFIYREEYYLANGSQEPSRYKKNNDIDQLAALENSKGKAELIVSKNRHGKLGTIHLNWDAGRQVFCD
jgi:replicative DNA helicase